MDLIWGQCLLYQTKDLYHNTTSNLIDLKHILKGTKVTVYNHNRTDFLVTWDSLLCFSLSSLQAVRNSLKPIYLLHQDCNCILAILPKTFIKHLQRVHNVATRLLTHTRLRNHLNPSAHWLPELIAGSSIFKYLQGVGTNIPQQYDNETLETNV